MQYVTTSLLTLLSIFIAQPAFAQPQLQPILDPAHELELISTNFMLADGPAWDGWSLWIPDVKASSLK